MVAAHNHEQFQQTIVRCLHNPGSASIKLNSIRGIALHLCKACATTLAMEVEIEYPNKVTPHTSLYLHAVPPVDSTDV